MWVYETITPPAMLIKVGWYGGAPLMWLPFKSIYISAAASKEG